MHLRDWRQKQGWTLDRTAREIGLVGSNVARSLQRIELGEAMPDADIVAVIGRVTDQCVRPADISEVRLDWLRRNGRDRFHPAEPVSQTEAAA
jgi:transcriptional regulator with XRE-family HTH domain